MHKHLNECLLWHGTQPGAAEDITTKEFKLTLAGSHAGTLYGHGLYLAEAFTKSDEYARQKDSRGWRAMLLCRTVLGHYRYCDGPVDGAELQRQVLAGTFDSILGDRRKFRGTYREFVVFDSNQVYPAFLVWYTRETD